MKHLTRLFFVFLSLTFLLSSSYAQNGLDKEFGEVEIVRDTWGLPHVFAETDEGAMYGWLGYAAAEDRAFQMYYNSYIMQGRLAEIIGNVKKVNRDETALDNDRKMRTFGFYRAAKRLVNNLDSESVSFLYAYSNGVNDYISQNPGKLNYLFKELGLEPEPWTPADCIVSWWHFAQFFATDGTRDMIRYRNIVQGTVGGRGDVRGQVRSAQTSLRRLPPDDSAAVVQREDVSDEWLQRVEEFVKKYSMKSKNESFDYAPEETPKFSHAWVVWKSKTTTGSAVLVSDPQTAVRNPSLLYEFHVSGKTFNARGCGVAGSPVILIGWTEDVAWGVTALGADQADLFRLKTDSAHPDQYFFDGEWRDMKIFEENIKVKNGRSQKITIRETHFGPVATEFSFVRPNEGEIALKRIPVAETDRETIQGAIAMMRAKNVYQFAGAIEGWRFPSANIVFGDKEGNIGYWSLCANPIRSAYALEAGSAAHDGTESKFDWQGIVPYDLLPHVINPKRGFLATANHRTIGSFYNIPLGVSTGAGGHTGRSWRLYELLEKKEIFTPEDILDIHYDSVSPFRGDIVRIGLHLQDVLKEELLPETYMALALLGPWHKNGASSDLRSEGAEIATKINTMFRMVTTDLTQIYGGGESGLAYFLRTVTFRIENDPNAPINDLEKEYIDVVLADAWINTERAFGYDITKWQQRALNQVKRRKLGYFESLDGFPSLNPAHDITFPGITNVDGGTIKSQAGQAYTQWVPLHDVDSALSIMPVGTSELPDNPFRFSTLEKWGKGELHPAPITREGVEKYKVSSVVISR